MASGGRVDEGRPGARTNAEAPTPDPTTLERLESELAELELPRARRMQHERYVIKDVLRSPTLQRLVPDPLALRFGARYAVHHATRSPNFDQLGAAYERYLSGTPHERDARAIAIRAVALSGKATVAADRPWLLRNARQEGRQHIAEARSSGRMVIATRIHSSAMWVSHHLAVQFGHVRYGVAGGWFESGPLPVYAWRHYVRLEEIGGRYVVAGRNAYALLEELLNRGAGLSMAFGLPGTMPVRFMNKPAGLRSGIARLAFETGAVICPSQTTIDDDGTVILRWLPALAPEDFDGPASLLQALATAYEELLMARPELWEPTEPTDPLGAAARLWT